jgi:ribosomal protein L37AE/L43A
MEYCNKCGAEMVKNPKTNKWFCKDKCWLKEADDTGSYQNPQQKNEAIEILKEIRDILKKHYGQEE